MFLQVVDEATLKVFAISELSVEVITDLLNSFLAVPCFFATLEVQLGYSENLLGQVTFNGGQLSCSSNTWGTTPTLEISEGALLDLVKTVRGLGRQIGETLLHPCAATGCLK